MVPCQDEEAIVGEIVQLFGTCVAYLLSDGHMRRLISHSYVCKKREVTASNLKGAICKNFSWIHSRMNIM